MPCKFLLWFALYGPIVAIIGFFSVFFVALHKLASDKRDLAHRLFRLGAIPFGMMYIMAVAMKIILKK
jgi:hypothetical protein